MNKVFSDTSKSGFENIKYLAIDMDGTLLPDDKIIPDFTLKTLSEACEAGYTLCICTGRSFAGVYKYERLRSSVSYYICYEGGYIVDNTIKSNPLIIYNYSMPASGVRAVCDACAGHEVMLALLTDKDGLCLDCDDDVFSSVRIWGAEPLKVGRKEIALTANERNVYIALIYGGTGQIDSVWENFSDEIKKGFDVIDTFIDFKDMRHLVLKAAGVNKWNGISRVLALTGAGAENLMAFGDWHNDFEMIKNAGAGVAMKNAERTIIDAAAVTTRYNNNEQGVANFIKERLL